MSAVFLDNNSTTPVDPRVIYYSQSLLENFRANTTSSHKEGCKAKKSLENSRKCVADILKCKSDEVIFTSCSTESNNIVLQGFIMKAIQNQGGFKKATQKTFKRPCIMVCTTEHISVLNPLRFWEQQELIDVVEVPVDSKGFVDMQAYVNLLKNSPSGVDLVSISHVNNEVGTLQDIRKLCKFAHQYGAFFHTDATQSVGKVPINIRKWKLDSITWSSHKLYSISGAGGLTLSAKFQPHVQQIMFGNDNEHKYRPGSTDLFSILCMAKAMKICNAEIKSNLKHLVSLTKYLLSLLVKRGIPFRLNSGGVFSLNLSFRNSNLTSDELIHKLSQSRICVSKGSACKSRSTQESYVLDAMGLPEITPTLRIGIGKFNSKIDIDNFIAKLHTALE